MVLDKARKIVEEFIADLDDPKQQRYLKNTYEDLLTDRGEDVAYFLYANNIFNLADPSGRSYPNSYEAYSKYAWEAAALWRNYGIAEFRQRVDALLHRLWQAEGPADVDAREIIALVRTDLIESFKTVDYYLNH